MKMHERLADERREATLAIVEAAGLAFGGEAGLRAWLARQEPVATTGPITGPIAGPDAIARQDAAIRRLQGLLGSQPNALRDAIKVN